MARTLRSVTKSEACNKVKPEMSSTIRFRVGSVLEAAVASVDMPRTLELFGIPYAREQSLSDLDCSYKWKFRLTRDITKHFVV